MHHSFELKKEEIKKFQETYEKQFGVSLDYSTAQKHAYTLLQAVLLTAKKQCNKNRVCK